LNKRRVEEFSEDDHRTAQMLTGALHGGQSLRLRMANKNLLPPRNCPPWMKTDAAMTERFALACQRHEEDAQRMDRTMTSVQQEIDKLVEDGTITSFADIPESILTRVCLAQMADGRRPSAVNKAVEMAARIKGLLGDRQVGSADEVLDQLLEKLDARRSQKPTGPHSLEPDDGAATG